MGRTILNRRPLDPDKALCAWGNCGRHVDPDAPICRSHLIKAWAIVQATMRDLMDTPALPMPKAQGYVYFVRFRDRIKIGYTTNMISRMDAVPHDEILAVHPGTMQDEKRCHEAFSHLRENGEWFRIEPDLLAFIDDIARKAS